MGYYMSVDGGGSKTLAILFDDHLRLMGCGKGESINTNFDTYERIRSTMSSCIEQCLSEHKGISIEKLYISMPGPYKLFAEILESMAPVGETVLLTEGMMGILAGIQKTRGAVALAGTGSGAIWIDESEKIHIGGWGSLLGDQGSGFAIGKDGLEAAVKAYDNWGPETAIYDHIMEGWKLDKLWRIISMVYKAPSYRSVVASAAPFVSKAAREGDAVALGIIEKAGSDMAAQIIALLKRVDAAGEIPVTLCGGAWKGCRVMYDTFCSLVKQTFPQTDIRVPLFDPVMGGVIQKAMETHGNIDDELMERLKTEFSQFLYKIEG